ncbi:cyd operon YbgE family protein [Rhodocyclus purpureus]|uniref:cyd operon YbgE family protein n=1 Tax=Rhodocyclus purpureus TaxID=1067 RepID=UPI001912DACB|nr:cyd operon YbgE family protein [Rhodocyclus purpureus]MBK5912952.1 hypothetical protein [Rhodocyclus purpureus]
MDPLRTEPPARGDADAHEPRARIRWLPLVTAIAVMLGITVWPNGLAAPGGGADHWAATALFWSMSSGFVTGVGFVPRFVVWRWLFSGSACLLGLLLAAWRLWSEGMLPGAF